MTVMPAMAQELPHCSSESSGAVVCMTQRICQCSFVRSGLMVSEPEGWRWDCGLLHGTCHGDVSQDREVYTELPPGLSIDSSDQSIHLDQTTGINGSGLQSLGNNPTMSHQLQPDAAEDRQTRLR